jgi:hypothetical protein
VVIKQLPTLANIYLFLAGNFEAGGGDEFGEEYDGYGIE